LRRRLRSSPHSEPHGTEQARRNGSHPARPRAAWRAGSTDPRRRAAPASLEPSALLRTAALHVPFACSAQFSKKKSFFNIPNNFRCRH